MDVIDMINEGYIKESDVDDVDTEVVEVTYKLRVYDIDYDVTEDDIDPLGTMTEDAAQAEVQRVKDSLPKEVIGELTCAPEDIDDYVADIVTGETNWLVNSCSYEILEEK